MQIEDLLKPGQKSGRVMILSRPLTVDSNFLHLDALKAKCNFRLASIFFYAAPRCMCHYSYAVNLGECFMARTKGLSL